MRRLMNSTLTLLISNISIWRTFYFNFHYFPIKVAIKFPVIVYKSVRFKQTKGCVHLDFIPDDRDRIRIGQETYGFQRKNDYTIWEHLGGTVRFNRNVRIGKGTFISVGEKAVLEFEENATFGGNDRIICMKSVKVGKNTKVAWDVQIVDTDFLATVNTISNTRNSAEGPIIIGNNNWLGFGCTIMKGSITPDHCIVGANATIKGDFSGAGENIILNHEANIKVIAKCIKGDFPPKE